MLGIRASHTTLVSSGELREMLEFGFCLAY